MSKTSKKQDKPFDEKVPEVLAGKMTDNEGDWFTLTVKVGPYEGWIAFEAKKDRDEMGKAMVAALLAATATAKAAQVEAEDKLEVATDEIEKLKAQLPKAGKKIKPLKQAA